MLDGFIEYDTRTAIEDCRLVSAGETSMYAPEPIPPSSMRIAPSRECSSIPGEDGSLPDEFIDSMKTALGRPAFAHRIQVNCHHQVKLWHGLVHDVMYKLPTSNADFNGPRTTASSTRLLPHEFSISCRLALLPYDMSKAEVMNQQFEALPRDTEGRTQSATVGVSVR